jgi:hypothetical protein
VKLKLLAIAIASMASFPSTIVSARAEDASWGCQILLCAASQNPSWHGVPYCVPPMVKLIKALSLPGFSWPICLASGTGRPGLEIYDACPEGSTVAYSQSGGHGLRNEPDLCEKTVNTCQGKRSSKNDGTSDRFHWTSMGGEPRGCHQTVAIARPRRADPYYFDIKNDRGVRQRYWFDLNDRNPSFRD